MEQYTTTTSITTRLHNQHTGDYPVDIVERSSISIVSESDPRINLFLKKPERPAESKEAMDRSWKDGWFQSQVGEGRGGHKEWAERRKVHLVWVNPSREGGGLVQ